jgi:hypothetical protein
MANGVSTLNRALYAGSDFDTHNDDLRARLQVKFAADFNDFAISSLGIMLLDLTAFGLDTLSFYLDRRATDTFLATARTRKSVARLSRQLGYKMGGAVASSVDLDIGVTEQFAFDVPLPEGFQIKGPNNLVFEVAREVLFTTTEQGSGITKSVPAFEGQTISETFTSDGSPAQVFELRRVPDDKFVVQGSVVVGVDGAQFEIVDFLEFGETDQVEIGFNDEPSTVRFGDGVSGNIPTSGATIEVTYVASRGLEGQVAKETITEPVTPLVVLFQQIPLTINNAEGSVGGDNRETLASAKSFAPKVFKSRNVAVTSEDYFALAGSFADPLFGRVAVAKAISTRSSGADVTVQNFLADIQTGVTDLNEELTTRTAAINTILGDPDDVDETLVTKYDLFSILAFLRPIAAEIDGGLSSIDVERVTILTEGRAVKNKAVEVQVDATDIQDAYTAAVGAQVNLQATIDGITTVAADQLSAPTRASINADLSTISDQLSLISAEAALIQTAAGTDIRVSAENILTAVGEINRVMETVGGEDSVGGPALKFANWDLFKTQTLLLDQDFAGDPEDPADADNITFHGILDQVELIDTANTTFVSTVNTATAGINEHLDKVLADDCKANLVTVPILTRDAGGFYTAPSTGLISSLQDFLDERKEVTQTVVVASGANFLVSAVISARVGVNAGFSEIVVRTTVESVIEGVLRDRDFGAGLFISELTDAVLGVAGVGFVNVTIEGHIDSTAVVPATLETKLDASGNLIIEESEVITRGTTTVTTEAAPTT